VSQLTKSSKEFLDKFKGCKGFGSFKFDKKIIPSFIGGFYGIYMPFLRSSEENENDGTFFIGHLYKNCGKSPGMNLENVKKIRNLNLKINLSIF
jgi:hypothetical protein